MSASSGFERVSNLIESMKPWMVDLQRSFCRAAAVGPDNDGPGEAKKAREVHKAVIRLAPDEVTDISAPDERAEGGVRPNLIYRFMRGGGDSTVWILSHMDVVPPGDESLWDHDPFKIRVDGDRIYGRGTEDNQQAMVASICAVRAVLEAGVKPARNMGLVFVSDEETGSKKGLEYVLHMRPDIFSPRDLIIVPDAGRSDGSMIEVAEKSMLWLRVRVSGRQCHASTPHKGVNAARAAAHLTVLLDGLAERFSEEDPIFSPPFSTFEPTKKEANVPNINTIPGEDTFYFDCRVLPRYGIGDVLEEARRRAGEVGKKFDVRISVEPVLRMQAPPPTPVDAVVVRALKRAVERVYHVEPKTMGIGGGTVAAFFRRVGLPAVCWSKIEETAHAPNEYCLISNMVGDAKVFAHVFLDETE